MTHSSTCPVTLGQGRDCRCQSPRTANVQMDGYTSDLAPTGGAEREGHHAPHAKRFAVGEVDECSIGSYVRFEDYETLRRQYDATAEGYRAALRAARRDPTECFCIECRPDLGGVWVQCSHPSRAVGAFTKWFATNYPPDTVLSAPEWHAPKVYRAAIGAYAAAVADTR